jgi:hypothetical protein
MFKTNNSKFTGQVQNLRGSHKATEEQNNFSGMNCSRYVDIKDEKVVNGNQPRHPDVSLELTSGRNNDESVSRDLQMRIRHDQDWKSSSESSPTVIYGWEKNNPQTLRSM